MDSGDTFGALLPYVMSGVATALVSAIYFVLQKMAGVTMQQADRDALHSAILTALKGLYDTVGLNASTKDAVRAARAWAETSVPQAMNRLKPTDDMFLELVKGKIPEARAAVTAGQAVLASLTRSSS
jgi:hypothetical protein